MTKIIDFIVLIAYCALLYWLSSQKSLPMPQLFSFQDKAEHAAAYFVMGLLAWRTVRHFYQQALIQAALAAIFCSLYGASDEWHQSFVPGRSSDMFDWLADTVGATIAMMLLYWLRLKWLKKRTNTQDLPEN